MDFTKQIFTYLYHNEGAEEWITAAAIVYEGKVYTGQRHWPIMQHLLTIGATFIPNSTQGFVTNKGRFVDRKIAAVIAFDAGQTKVQKSSLTSEDVW